MSDVALEFHTRLRKVLDFAAIDESSSGDAVIVTGVTGEKIIVYSIFLVTGAAMSIVWKSAATTIVGASPLATNGGYHVESLVGITETADGEDLIINLSGNGQVGGTVTYASIPT